MGRQWYFWVETKGKTLEEIDAIFDGEKHSAVPDVEKVRAGRVSVDRAAIESDLREDKVISKTE
jgi:hypothetical protein